MNILFCNFDEEWHKDLIGSTAREVGAESVVTITTRYHDLSEYTESNCWIPSDDFNQKRYDFMKDKVLPPLDTKLIEELRWCESLYYPMLDRMEVDILKSVTYHQRKRYYENDLRCMLWILEQHKIDLVVFYTIPHISFDYALYGVCKAKGIPMVMGYFSVMVPHRAATVYFLSEIQDHMPQLQGFKPQGLAEEQIHLPERMQSYYDHYARDKSQVKSFIFYSDYANYKTSKLQRVTNLVLSKFRQRSFFRTVRRKIVQHFNAKRLGKYLSKYSSAGAEGKYIYYPLHYQPECTSLPMGGVYYDQLHVLRLLSKLLPDDVTVYVKPHPNRNLLTGESFYEEIRSLRNVKLVSSNANTYELIDNALAVVSLTGTAILESLIRGTPAMMFGYYIWQYAPNVFHCVNEEDCKEAIDRLCSGYQYDKAAFMEFLCELDKHLVDGVMSDVLFDLYSIPLEDNIRNIKDSLVAYIRKVTDGETAQ